MAEANQAFAHFRYCRRRSLGAGGNFFVPTSRPCEAQGELQGQLSLETYSSISVLDGCGAFATID